MARRKGNYSCYERMFENLLRQKEVVYVATDENRRPVSRYGNIKNFDFIVHSSKCNYTIDLKGREFPQSMKPGRPGLKWQNWIKLEDINGLDFWHRIMGNNFSPLIVFAYKILKPDDIFLFWDLCNFEDNSFGLIAITLDDYKSSAKLRSEKWGAYSLKKADFLNAAKPLRFFIPEIAP
ncbi:MAG: HYExAFE family protein [Firmicutes bacterium]|nr:HYExAFE family protein [Bacillota bacterium]